MEKELDQLFKSTQTKVRHIKLFKKKTPKRIVKAEWVELDGKRAYCRSRWEANYFRYLHYLKFNGVIKDFFHEPERFYFDKIKRGTNSYLPDFKVINNDDSHEWFEVKGFMDSKSKTQIKRFKKYFPNEKLILVTSKEYKQIEKIFSRIIPFWEK